MLVISVTHSQINYYWVGGSGDWQDPNNWSLTSNGPPAGLSPNNGDNVIFDQFSFDAPGQIVTTTNNIFCHDKTKILGKQGILTG